MQKKSLLTIADLEPLLIETINTRNPITSHWVFISFSNSLGVVALIGHQKLIDNILLLLLLSISSSSIIFQEQGQQEPQEQQELQGQQEEQTAQEETEQVLYVGWGGGAAPSPRAPSHLVIDGIFKRISIVGGCYLSRHLLCHVQRWCFWRTPSH